MKHIHVLLKLFSVVNYCKIKKNSYTFCGTHLNLLHGVVVENNKQITKFKLKHIIL